MGNYVSLALTEVELTIAAQAVKDWSPVDPVDARTRARLLGELEAARVRLAVDRPGGVRNRVSASGAASRALALQASADAGRRGVAGQPPADLTGEELVAGLVWEGSSIQGGCPDLGTCHHGCLERGMTTCYRSRTCSPLSGVFKGDKWPVDCTPFSARAD